MCDAIAQLNFTEHPHNENRPSGSDSDPSKNDKRRIKPSNFYNQKKNLPYAVYLKHTPKQLTALATEELSEEKPKVSSKVKMKSKIKTSLGVKKPSTSVKKPVSNVSGKKYVFTDKGNGGSNKNISLSENSSKLTTKLMTVNSSRKRGSCETNDEKNCQQSPHKKPKLDINMNKSIEESKTHEETDQDTVSSQELGTNQVSLTKQRDIIDLCDEIATLNDMGLTENQTKNVVNKVKNGPNIKRQQNLKTLIGTLPTDKDSGFQENFRTVQESSQDNTPSLCSSPLMFSSTSSSSGFVSSSNSRTSSPEQQSSITKYFSPVRGNLSGSPQKKMTVSPRVNRSSKRSLPLGKDASPSSPASNKKEQMYLDLGQKDFGHVTCPTCNMVYTRAQPEDEADHLRFHQKFITCLRFQGWKTERVLGHFDDGRIIVVLPNDHSSHLKKVADVRSVVDNELGFSSETCLRMQDAQTYMFISNNKVIGCVVAVDVQQAYPVLPSDVKEQEKTEDLQGTWCCSSTPVRAQCGISRVWVLQQYRRQKIATRLLDCVRYHFIFGCVVDKETLAFSDPTPVGKRLAESYTGSETFLVFR